MINYHKFEKYFRLANGMRDTSPISISVKNSLTGYAPAKYATSPFMYATSYQSFPYVANSGKAEFYLPAGTYDIMIVNSGKSSIIKNVQIGTLVGYDFEELDPEFLIWSKPIYGTDGQLLPDLTMRVDQYTADNVSQPIEFMNQNMELVDEMFFNYYAKAYLPAGLMRITISDIDGELVVYDHESIGCYCGTDPGEYTELIWSEVDW